MSIFHTLRFIANHPLNQRHKPQALLRFFHWQLISRATNNKLVYDWISPARLMIRSKDSGLTGNIYCGLHEYPDMAYVLHTIEPSSLFVDVGANLGSYTLLACAVRGARGYSFEPLPSTFERLMDNLRLNDLTERVTALNIGIGEDESELHFSSDEDTKNHVLRPSERKGHTRSTKVKVQPLDQLLKEESPSLIKIDVEGFETSVIRGAQETLRKASLHSVLMELGGAGEFYGFDEDELLRHMHSLGFRTFGYDPMKRQLLRPGEYDQTQSINTLLIKNLDEVEQLLKRTPKITINDNVL